MPKTNSTPPYEILKTARKKWLRHGLRPKAPPRATRVMMQSWQATAYGEGGNPADTISKLVLKADVPIPVAKDGQVVIKVEMCAINPIDWRLFSGGLHGILPVTFPYTPGFDISGTISAVGAGVTGLAVGDKVCVDLGLVETCKDPAPAGPCGGLAQYAAALQSAPRRTGRRLRKCSRRGETM